MPLPNRYRKPVDDLFAGRITSKELKEIIERIDGVQRSFMFRGVQPYKGEYRPALRREQIYLARYGEASRAAEN